MKRDVRLHIEGAMLERLLQLAADSGAGFARIKRTSPRSLLIDTDEAGMEILLGLCRQYRLELRIVRVADRSQAMRRLQARRTLAAAVLSCILVSAWLLSRVWIIDIGFTGYCAALGDENRISQLLGKAGIHRGMDAGRIDAALLEKQLSSQMEDYSYIGVRLQGVRLLVEASPEVPVPDLYARSAKQDIVAARDGIVESIEVYAGTACVKPGDTVHAGQVLIRGEEDKSKEEVVGVAALGKVIARSWFEGRAQGSLSETVLRRSGEHGLSSRICLMDTSLPIVEFGGFGCEETESFSLPIGGIYLPLRIEYTTHYLCESIQRKLDTAALERNLRALARAEAAAKIENSIGNEFEIADFWVDITQDTDNMYVRAVFEIYTDIAAARDAHIEEVYETWNTSSP